MHELLEHKVQRERIMLKIIIDISSEHFHFIFHNVRYFFEDIRYFHFLTEVIGSCNLNRDTNLLWIAISADFGKPTH